MNATSSRHGRSTIAFGLGLLLAIGSVDRADAITLDGEGDMRLGMRAYTAVRVGTNKIGGKRDPLSWPRSGAGHVRQHRSFISLDFTHDIISYARDGYGVGRGFGLLFPNILSYTLQYRGEFEGIYDYGPEEYRNYSDTLRRFRRDVPKLQPLIGKRLSPEYVRQFNDRLRRIGRQRHRLFLAYLDYEKGPLFVRVGRQILAWGETDVFRLLDNINPLDDSFGGFFIALDERRLPIEMIRASWNFGSFPHFADVVLEGFVATGNRISQWPGIPQGSPWNPGGLGYPNPALKRRTELPDREDVRGGMKLGFTSKDITFTLAHYYTYLDIPGVRFRLPGCRPKVPAGTPCPPGNNTASFGNEVIATAESPRVPITGAALSFALPSIYSIARAEVAYFQDEPMNRQGEGNANLSAMPLGSAGAKSLAKNKVGGLDPFVWPAFLDTTRGPQVHGRLLQLDTFNASIGLDINRYVRQLNPHQSFFISTQMFYKHVFDSPGDLVLPVPHRNTAVPKITPLLARPGDNPLGVGCKGNGGRRRCKARPSLIALEDDRFRHTLLITTAYGSGRIVPAFAMFYDWQGAILVQPGVTLIRDPFRFIVDYTAIMGPATADIGAVRDRDNVRFQVEFVF